MNLLSLDEMQRRLLEQYEAFDREIAELNMKDSSLSESDLITALNIQLPESFKKLILKYDFGELNIGGVFWGQKGNYIEFLKSSNMPGASPAWWGQGVRPQNHLMIAGTDGYVLLLDILNGNIVAYLRTENWTENRRIADTFKQLVCGAGTIHFNRRICKDKKALGKKVARKCGVDVYIKFWEELAQGIT
ncbi:MAG: SMI1/KNR4 family protein [Aestuariibacter sp.]|nr:SMI1/KNR4 family protein [Aestuariibacter sp.]